MVRTANSHLWSISIEYTSVVCLSVNCEELLNFRIKLITISYKSCLSHVDTAVWLK